jgi:hypothetical protein
MLFLRAVGSGVGVFANGIGKRGHLVYNGMRQLLARLELGRSGPRRGGIWQCHPEPVFEQVAFPMCLTQWYYGNLGDEPCLENK